MLNEAREKQIQRNLNPRGSWVWRTYVSWFCQFCRIPLRSLSMCTRKRFLALAKAHWCYLSRHLWNIKWFIFTGSLCYFRTAGLPMSYKLGLRWNAVITRSDFISEVIFGFLSPNSTGQCTWFFFVNSQNGLVTSFSRKGVFQRVFRHRIGDLSSNRCFSESDS